MKKLKVKHLSKERKMRFESNHRVLSREEGEHARLSNVLKKYMEKGSINPKEY